MGETHLAYDGSISGDWISLYAIRMAKARSGRLVVLHVEDGDVDLPTVQARLARIERQAAQLGVEVGHRILPRTRDVSTALLDAVGKPTGVLVCGLRARESGRGLLRGTVSQDLLAAHRHDVLALRVLAPGLLGAPHRALYAASNHLEGATEAGEFLAMLADELDTVELLRVATFPALRGHAITPSSRERMLGVAHAHVQSAQELLEAALKGHGLRFDHHAALAADWADEVVRHAARIKSQLILLGASERTLPMRMLAGNPLERVLHGASCDVGIFRKARGN